MLLPTWTGSEYSSFCLSSGLHGLKKRQNCLDVILGLLSGFLSLLLSCFNLVRHDSHLILGLSLSGLDLVLGLPLGSSDLALDLVHVVLKESLDVLLLLLGGLDCELLQSLDEPLPFVFILVVHFLDLGYNN